MDLKHISRVFSELIRNHTLKFLSKALPALKADGTLPKVTEIFQEQMLDGQYNNRYEFLNVLSVMKPIHV